MRVAGEPAGHEPGLLGFQGFATQVERPKNRAGNGRQIGEPPAAVVGDIEPAAERLDLLEQPHGAVQVAGSL